MRIIACPSCMEPELIGLEVIGVANLCDVSPIPAEKGIEDASFFSQPSVVVFPRAYPFSLSLAPFNASFELTG